MPLVTFQRIDYLGEIVIDRPPQNLFSLVREGPGHATFQGR
jgi:hypothetical protein